MKKAYVIGIDQSTQGTKAMLFDENGKLLVRVDKSHAQLIDHRGWVEHDGEEIYKNTLWAVEELLKKSVVDRKAITCVGISNQRETAIAWNRKSGKPVYNAIVWQCARGEEICRRLEQENRAKEIRQKTGLRISPYFSAAKWAWILENIEEAEKLADQGELCCGTMDSFLVYRLTKGKAFRTDYSNASRTQLFNIVTMSWDKDLCGYFGVPCHCLPEVTDSDGMFGMTDFGGILPCEIPIHSVMGDSHGALFGQGCLSNGKMKVTYGTGSSIMMNIGEKPVFSDLGLVTSLAWKTNGTVQYVLEGNVNYTGAVVSWMKDQAGFLENPADSEDLARLANPADHTILVPAFSGLGAPYWRSEATAAFVGMSRTTGRPELVKAGLCSIAFQISDIVGLMKEAVGIKEIELRADGGPTKNKYLMQFQSDVANCKLLVSGIEEISGMGVAFAAGLSAGVYSEAVFNGFDRIEYIPQMEQAQRKEQLANWKKAVETVLCYGRGNAGDN